MIRGIAFFLSFWLSLPFLYAKDVSLPVVSIDAPPPTVYVRLFSSAHCPSCEEAYGFLQSAAGTRPWLQIERYQIDKDKKALLSFHRYLLSQKSTNFTVPAIFFCDSYWQGFIKGNTPWLLKSLDLCYQALTQKEASASQEQIKELAQNYQENFLLTRFTKLNGGIWALLLLADASSGGALAIVLLYFFRQEMRKKRLFSMGLFLLPIGVLHYFQQTAIVSFYMIAGPLRIIGAIAGLGFLVYAYFLYQRRTLSFPYFCIFSAITGIILGLFQYLSGLQAALLFYSMLETSAQGMPHTAQLLLYTLGYLLALVLMMFSIAWLGRFSSIAKSFPIALFTWLGLLLLISPSTIMHFLGIVLLFLLLWLSKRWSREA